MCAATMALIAMGTSMAGGAVSAYGAIQSGDAQSKAALYNRDVSLQNAKSAKDNAGLVSEAGSARVGIEGQKTRSNIGSIVANQAASGIDVNSGSAVDVRASAAELGLMDAMTIRSNAVKEAYGYQVQSVGHEAQAGLDLMESKEAKKAAKINAVGTFLGSAGNAGANYQNYQIASGNYL